MEKKLSISLLVLLIFFLFTGWLFYQNRNRPLITRITDNYWAYNFINQTAKITDLIFLHYTFYPDKLDNYQLFIKGSDLEKLEKELPSNPEKQSIMTQFTAQAPAVLVDPSGTEHKVEVRFRGDLAVHWAERKKSWRILLKNNDTFNSLNSFDLIIPEDQGLVLEHLANFRAKKLNLYSPDSWFANLKLNQSSQGIYYFTERLDEDFFIRRNLIGTLFGEKDQLDPWNVNIYQDAKYWRTYPEDPHNPDFKYLKELLEMINNPQSTSEEIFQLIDKDSFLNWQVHSLLMASLHQDQSHNSRLFFNHQSQKFELIPWDTGNRTSVSEDINLSYNPLAIRLLADPQVKAERNQRLKTYLDNPDNQVEDLAYFNQAVDLLKIALIKDTNKFHPTIKYLLDLKQYRLWMGQHFDNLKHQL